MNPCYKERKWFMWLMTAAALFGCLNFATSQFDFIRLIASARAFKLPNILFFLFRSMLIAAPIMLILPGNNFMAKILRTKIVFGLWTAFCLFGVLWAFFFVSDESFRKLFDFDTIYEFQISARYLFVGNYIQWGTYRLSGTVFSLILFLMMCADTTLLHQHRYISAGAALITFLYCLLAPLVFRIAVYHTFYTSTWLKNNVFAILSAASLTAGICVAARNDVAWLELMWGEVMPDHMTDDYDEDDD